MRLLSFLLFTAIAVSCGDNGRGTPLNTDDLPAEEDLFDLSDGSDLPDLSDLPDQTDQSEPEEQDDLMELPDEDEGPDLTVNDIDHSLFGQAGACGTVPATPGVTTDACGFIVNGAYRLLRGGTIQWFRLPPSAWRDRLEKFRDAGFNTVDIYVAWNRIEPREGEFVFNDPDITGFLDLCTELGLMVYFRPGPYICNELDGGGLPAWLFTKTTKKNKNDDDRPNLRTDDPDYLFYATRYLTELNKKILPYLASNGGPVVLYGIENEYNWFETFFEVDKLFAYDGGTERGLTQATGVKKMFESLRDAVIASGVDVPITTCPGDATVSGMGDVTGVIPMPNIYKNETTERYAYDTLISMHDPTKFGGAYTNYPSGSTETDRSPGRMMRLFLGGMDGYFGFNIAGFHQEGRQNALTLDNSGLETIVDLSPQNVLSLFVSPTVNYFSGVIDFYGPIGAAGTLREKYFEFRRFNMFLDDVEPLLAGLLLPAVVTTGPCADCPVAVLNGSLGALEGQTRRHYYFTAADGAIFLGLTNESDAPITVAPGEITVGERSIPRFVPLTVPVGVNPGAPEDPHGDTSYARILIAGLPIGPVRIAHTTSEVLRLRRFNDEVLVALHGPKGSEGELLFDDLPDGAKVTYRDGAVTQRDGETGTIALTYTHDGIAQALLSAGGTTVRVLILDSDAAGRFWALRSRGHDLILVGPDRAESASDGTLRMEYDERQGSLALITPVGMTIPELSIGTPRDETTGLSRWRLPAWSAPLPVDPTLLGIGALLEDGAAAMPGYDDSDWITWTGEPEPLEEFDILSGHAWYRATIDLPGTPTEGRLYIEHASDIVGIYVNGVYVTTVSPVGTEIDSDGSERYRFADIAPLLHAGENLIAFRVEIWGHGSFMWPRGKMAGFPGQMPSLGFDSLKGLWGSAYFRGKVNGSTATYDLASWRLRAATDGELDSWHDTDSNELVWPKGERPATLPKGGMVWYRVPFTTTAILRDGFDAPPALVLKGRNAKATIWINGILAGRWLSDEEWLCRGTWTRCLRSMWSVNEPDAIPVAPGLLFTNDSSNTLTILFEDTSADTDTTGGTIEELFFGYAAEELTPDGDRSALRPLPRRELIVHLTD